MAKKTEIRPVDKVLNDYSKNHQNPINRTLQWVYIPLLTFGLLGLIWSLPFPHLAFLGKYNGYINWVSFIIAFSVYYYYKLSPVLSYGMLFMVFAISAGVVSLEKIQDQNGNPILSQVCIGVLIAGLVLQFIGCKQEGKMPTLAQSFNFLLIGPFWLVFLLLKKTRIRY
jgi:uncharacterized membrane protein YGL010W